MDARSSHVVMPPFGINADAAHPGGKNGHHPSAGLNYISI
jgi:hypothetical protein